MKKVLLNFFLVLLVLLGSQAYAQNRVSGKVTGKDDGQPLVGVSVKIKGSTLGTQTGADGRFVLNAPANATIIFSYIGFVTQEVAASTDMNVSLIGASGQLADVVVVAYGAQKKEAITGSVASLSSKDLDKRTVTNIAASLQGLAPGIQVAASNGQPGATPTIRIRGFGSFSASQAPLYVLDGSVYDGSIGDINQNDVESISVLKDASASALYGSRGANGVVIITTKRGKGANPTISANLTQGFSERGIPEYDRVNAYQYYPLVWQGIKNNLMYTASPTLTEANAAARASATVGTNLVYNPFNVPANQVVGLDGAINPNASLLYDDFDWFKAMQRTGKRTDANLSVSGRTDKTDYFISTGYLKDNSLTQSQWFDYGTYPGAVNRPQGASPGRHVLYETMLNEYMTRRNQMSARTYVEVKFLKDFTFTPTFSVDLRNNNGSTFQNKLVGDGVTQGGYKSQSNNTIRSYTFNQILRYDKTIAGDHNITALVGHENYDYDYRTFSAARTTQILAGNTEFANFATANSSSGQADKDRIESIFSQATYNYKEKYFIDGSLRRDGSSRFAPKVRWGTFFSVGGGWSISKEDFLRKATWIDDLRLKASYGQVGNNKLLDGDNANYYADRSFYELGWNNGLEPGALLNSVANPDLRWEKQNTFNAGVSFSLFNRRLTGEVEYFKKTVNDLLFNVPLAISDPVTTIPRNIGSMYNKGIEIQLGGDIVRSKSFNWNLLTNWTFLKNKVTSLPSGLPIISGTKRREEGYDYYQFWLRQYAGVDPADGSALYVPDYSTTILAANKRTVNGVEYVTSQSNALFARSGSAIPDLSGSFTNTFSYKNLSLTVLATYQIGGKYYDGQYQGLMSVGSYGSSMHIDQLKAWTQTNTTASIPRIDYGKTADINATSSRWLVDASFLAIRNVNLAYNLPRNWLRKVDITGARLFVTGENLHLFSKRKGLNPTESFDGTNSTTYPQARMLSVGLNVTL
ncbi:SusC/RagA family TonB-linked outer membrane protein [Mucilaginibacter daejeonensis]|uniref:SusC/RagA family TonB-linked outer membrane protein n=1 Tax=Mucilaginibacter daejeonensis TaxID=398049 RepID=UPI001D179B03|nr:SusC/RagA family TonB-linked outer membrane protein [Mucilaginibacter daejeonensis]UEG53548.1 SusC/RagA family TonB-linked outer membrane protein [Mucilaginibacter daejeonensis]